MSEPSRFGLEAIEAERARIAAAREAARSHQNGRSAAKLAALANLPWVIALLVWLATKYL